MAQEDNNQQQSNTGTSLNQPKIGMNLDSNPIDLTGAEYSLLVNGNILSADGNLLKITNEPSNLLCSRFKPGFKVIGKPLYIPVQHLTVFFLVNPTTNSSEIGMITNTYYDDTNDRTQNCQDCNHPIIEDVPLEKTVQTPLCNYVTIVNAPCLNFNINYPIDATYEVGIDVVTQLPDCNNITVFFTDFLNPRRFLNLKNIPQQIIGVASGNCNQPITNGLLDCNEILVAPNYTDGCVMSTEIRQGGRTTAGTYQFGACYCDVTGNPVSDYFVVSNPTSVWDSLKTVTVNTDYITGQAIALNISNLDVVHFLYLKLVVVRTVNNVSVPSQVGIFNINSTNFQYTYTGQNSAKELPISINELLDRRTHYDRAKGVTKSNDTLFWYNLAEQRIINLQPVVNNLRLQWQTIEVEEGFYADGTHVANYLSYERDEVYTFGIEFRLNTGYKLPTFLISAQPDSFYNNGHFYNNNTPYGSYTTIRDAINNTDVLANPNCCAPSGCQLSELWEVYNTATNKGIGCNYIAPSSGHSVVKQVEYCSSLYQMCQVFPCDLTHYPYPVGAPVSCCPSGATECKMVGDPILVIPSGTQNIPIYSPNPTIYQPNMTTDLPASWIPSGCGGYPICSGVCCLQQVNLYTTPNNIPTNPYILSASNSTTCNTDPNAGNTSNKPAVFFQYVPAPVKAPLGTCGVGNSDNVTWFQFTATNSVQAITVSPFYPVPIVIVAYSDFGITEIGCNYGTVGGYLVLQNLNPGATYYFAVYTPDPTFTSLVGTYGQLEWLFGTLCINTPNPIRVDTVNIPAVFSQNYSYETSGSTTVLNTAACELQTYQYGDFSYWESTAHYPNNPDVWGALCGQPIRHHKFPDCAVSHIHDGPITSGYGVNNKIYPIGVRLDVNQIKGILQQAVSQNLITDAERLNITGYSIKRGNRRNNRSIQAKGFLTDVWRTPLLQLNYSQGKLAAWTPVLDGNGQPELVYYPNYVFNDNSGLPDFFISAKQNIPFSPVPVFAPYESQGSINGRYTFHSPNTSFAQPFLTQGQELKLETVENGYTNAGMNEVLYHSKYVLLSTQAYAIAEALAGIEIIFDATLASTNAGGALTSFAYVGIYFAATLIEGLLLNQGKYTSQWADIFKKLGTPQNPAIYYTGVGKYNGYTPVLNEGITRKRAQIENSQYLQPGNFQFSENGQVIRFNNFERETSVYLSTDAFTTPNIDPTKAFKPTSIFGLNFTDTSKSDAFNNFNTNCSVSTSYISSKPNIASYYASIKNYVPDQYGTPDQIEWLDTGYCGVIDWKNNSQSTVCNTIFGGDTFINRFAYKEKMPMFTDDRVFTQTTNINTDVFYQNLGNVGYPNYFFNSMYDEVTGSIAQSFFGFTPPTTQFLCQQNTFFYQRGKCPLYFYSIPYFICESDYNVDLRHGEDELAKNFYPYVGDVVNWTQQYQVPISTDNFYFYNLDYSKQNFENFAYILKNNFSNLTDVCQTTHPTRLIWSPQGTLYWLNYLAADEFDFPREDGTVIIVKELEELKILVVQEQGNKIFNNYNTLNTNGVTIAVQSGSLFKDLNNKPSQIYATDLGFAGTQNFAIESTPKGTFYVDTRNPAILSVTRTMYGRNVTNDILEAKEGKTKVTQWMRNNLPFQILKDYPNVDVNNPYKYFGIATAWDNKFDRLFITKRDARVKPEFKNVITFNEGQQEFYLNDAQGNKTLVIPTDSRYFCDKSWTISYSPTLGEWTSFFTTRPNYWIGTESFFQGGLNFPVDQNPNKIGLWTWGLSQKSFCVFEGQLEKFMFEYVLKDTINSTNLGSISFNMEMYRYQDSLNWAIVTNKTVNKALIYNQLQSTGMLNLIPTVKNNLYQLISYPKYNIDSRDILIEQNATMWSFNNFNNVAWLNEQPNMLFECGNVMYKNPNPLALNYAQVYLPNKIRGDYQQIRLISDIYSNYKIIMKHGTATETNTI